MGFLGSGVGMGSFSPFHGAQFKGNTKTRREQRVKGQDSIPSPSQNGPSHRKPVVQTEGVSCRCPFLRQNFLTLPIQASGLGVPHLLPRSIIGCLFQRTYYCTSLYISIYPLAYKFHEYRNYNYLVYYCLTCS